MKFCTLWGFHVVVVFCLFVVVFFFFFVFNADLCVMLVSWTIRICRKSRLLKCLLFLFVAKSLFMLLPWCVLLSVSVVFPGHVHFSFIPFYLFIYLFFFFFLVGDGGRVGRSFVRRYILFVVEFDLSYMGLVARKPDFAFFE